MYWQKKRRKYVFPQGGHNYNGTLTVSSETIESFRACQRGPRSSARNDRV